MPASVRADASKMSPIVPMVTPQIRGLPRPRYVRHYKSHVVCIPMRRRWWPTRSDGWAGHQWTSGWRWSPTGDCPFLGKDLGQLVPDHMGAKSETSARISADFKTQLECWWEGNNMWN